MFRHTSTLGIREKISKRYTLERSEGIVSTKYGEVRVKTSSGYGNSKVKAEHGDVSRLAREHGVTIEDIKKEAEK